MFVAFHLRDEFVHKKSQFVLRPRRILAGEASFVELPRDVP
jgi:hypothetical protein